MSVERSVLAAVRSLKVAFWFSTVSSRCAVVVMLVWLSWTVNALFYGAALATEIEAAQIDHAAGLASTSGA